MKPGRQISWSHIQEVNAARETAKEKEKNKNDKDRLRRYLKKHKHTELARVNNYRYSCKTCGFTFFVSAWGDIGASKEHEYPTRKAQMIQKRKEALAPDLDCQDIMIMDIIM